MIIDADTLKARCRDGVRRGRTGSHRHRSPFEALCEENRVPYVVVTSFDQAVAILKSWGVVRGR